MLGLASRDEEPEGSRTLLVYDAPLPVLRFPLFEGDAWSASTSFRDALLAGIRNSGEETYDFEADATGTVLLPGWELQNALRLRVDVTQTFALAVGENTRSFMEVMLVRECAGELARAVGLPGETDLGSLRASEFRRLDTGG